MIKLESINEQEPQSKTDPDLLEKGTEKDFKTFLADLLMEQQEQG